MASYRKEVQEYIRVAERLLAASLTGALTEDELRIVEYYADEIAKALRENSLRLDSTPADRPS